MMFNLFKKNVNMKEVGQNKALTWSCYGVKSRITSIMEGKWTDNGTIVRPDWCGRGMAYDRLAGVTGTALRKIAAVFCLLTVMGVGNVLAREFSLVTSVSQLEEETEIVILKHDASKALGADNTNNRSASTDFSKKHIDNNDTVIVSGSSSVQIITIEKEDGYYLFKVGSAPFTSSFCGSA